MFRGPIIYRGGLLLATAGGAATVALYDGAAVTDEPLDAFRAAASEHDQHYLDGGIRVNRGVFVDLGANVDWFLLYFDPEVPVGVAGPVTGP